MKEWRVKFNMDCVIQKSDSKCCWSGGLKLPTVRFVFLLCVIYKLESPCKWGTERFVGFRFGKPGVESGGAFSFMNKMPTQTRIEEEKCELTKINRKNSLGMYQSIAFYNTRIECTTEQSTCGSILAFWMYSMFNSFWPLSSVSLLTSWSLFFCHYVVEFCDCLTSRCVFIYLY